MDQAPGEDLNARDLAAQKAFEQYELVLSALLSSHARSGRVLDQWEVEDLAASLPEYKMFTAVQREYNTAVGALVSKAKLSEQRAKLSTRDGDGARKPSGDARLSSPPPPPRLNGRSPATLATPASRRATSGRRPSKSLTTPQHQGGITQKRRRLLGRMLSAMRYPQRLLRLRRPGAVVRARDKYVEGANVGRCEPNESKPQRPAPVAATSAQTHRSAQLVGPA